jgi:hypothetical protein
MLLHPSIDEKGMRTMRLHRLHLSSSPPPTTLAINCPHSQRVSFCGLRLDRLDFTVTMLR